MKLVIEDCLEVLQIYLRKEGDRVQVRAALPNDYDGYLLLEIHEQGIQLAGSVPPSLGFPLTKKKTLVVEEEVC